MNLKREIYEVHLAYVNADGYHASDPNVGGTQYPVVIDSKTHDNNVEETLRSIHTGLGDYNTRVLIETEDNVYDTKIISKGNKEILTENNKLIPINKIVDIKIKK